MRRYRAYRFMVTVHQILIESLLFKDCSDMTSYLRTPPTDSSDRVETSWTVRLYDGTVNII